MADLVLGIGIALVFGAVVEQDVDRAERVDGVTVPRWTRRVLVSGSGALNTITRSRGRKWLHSQPLKSYQVPVKARDTTDGVAPIVAATRCIASSEAGRAGRAGPVGSIHPVRLAAGSPEEASIELSGRPGW
jgi:hypothetical protein